MTKNLKKTKELKNERTKELSSNTSLKVPSIIARTDDGTIQITFTIAYDKIKKARLEATKELAKNIDISGFRKGKAPLNKAIEKIPPNTLVEKTLAKILPKLLGEAIKEHNLKPAMYPKFEIIKAKDDEDWQVRATTCELPEIKLGDYKKAISGASKAKAIWTPSSANLPAGKAGVSDGKPDQKAVPTQAQKEQEVIKILLESVNFSIPKLLINDEVNSRLSKLLERVEKLGLSLESYLKSLGKTADQLRNEYEQQAKNAIKLDFILAQIVKQENIQIKKEQVDAAIKAGSADPNLAKKLDTPQQRRLIESILARRTVLDSLTSLL